MLSYISKYVAKEKTGSRSYLQMFSHLS